MKDAVPAATMAPPPSSPPKTRGSLFRRYVLLFSSIVGGAFLSYGPNLDAMFGRAAFHVDKTLKGALPGALPIEQPTRFELVLNLKAARALEIDVPSTFLVSADEVIA